MLQPISWEPWACLEYRHIPSAQFSLAFLVSANPQQLQIHALVSDQSLTKQIKTEYAAHIAESLHKKVKPASVEVDAVLRSGTWTVVYASIPVADPGYFFFESSSGAPVFKDVWGGFADDDDGPDLIKWARELGANKEIAS